MMNKEELYKLALSNVPRYSLLNEILAIRDNRFPDEENDYTIKVYGSIGLDVLNRYVRFINELVEYENIDTINNLKDLQQKLDKILTYAKKQCDDYLKEDDCEYCDGVFASCRKVLQLAGEDINEYE